VCTKPSPICRNFSSIRSHSIAATLCTEQIEPVFNIHPDVRRTALVGIGKYGEQLPVLCVELREGVAAMEWERIELKLRHMGEGFVHTAQVQIFLRYPRPFPVDIRHNAKIGREKLALWASKLRR
jgi:olefin beta-lactone synthetase